MKRTYLLGYIFVALTLCSAPLYGQEESSLPEPVTLVSPSAGQTVITDGIRFTWNSGGNLVDKYQLQLSKDALFTKPLLSIEPTDTMFELGVLAEGTYYWRVRAHDLEWGPYSEARTFTMKKFASVQDDAAAAGFTCAPNPASTSTMLRFDVAQPCHARLVVTDMLGRIVAVPLDGEIEAGKQSIEIDLSMLDEGSYFYSFTALGRTISGPISVVR